MADQLRPAPIRASMAAIIGRILFALVLVMGVLVAIPLLVGAAGGLWAHAELVLLVGVGVVVLILLIARVARTRR